MLDCSRICLTRPPSSGKTSLLFRQALHWAGKSGRDGVLFVAPSPLDSLPLLPHTAGSDSVYQQPDPHVLSRIHFKYPANLTELLHLLTALHVPQHQTTPYNSIIVDDVHKFVSNQATGKGASMTAELAQVCAYTVDAAKYLSQRTENEITGGPLPSGVALSLSTHMRNAEMMIEIVRRWMSDVFTISSHGESGFTVTEAQSGTKCLQYQLAYPYLQIMPTT